MPKIGCGLDELSWDKVKPLLKEIFKAPFQIKIYTGPNSSQDLTPSGNTDGQLRNRKNIPIPAKFADYNVKLTPGRKKKSQEPLEDLENIDKSFDLLYV